jgi:hypothetical protein
MTSIADFGSKPGGYQIGFECSTRCRSTVEIRRAGLKETDRLVSDSGQIVLMTLQDSETGVEVGGVVNSHFTIKVWPVAP